MEAIRDLAGLWNADDYPVFGDRWLDISRRLAEDLDVDGKQLLDVGTGPGATAIEAALKGAEATGLDYSTSLLTLAEQRAEAAGVKVNWHEDDMHRMSLPDESFDLVVSTFGTCYSLDPHAVASECVRVCRRDGRVVSVSFTPESAFGKIRETLKQFMFQEPARELTQKLVPAVVQRPNDTFDWGVPSRVEAFFGDAPLEWEHRHHETTIRWASLDEAAHELSTKTPPMVITHRVLTELGWWDQAHQATRERLTQIGRETSEGYEMDLPYLVAIGTRH